MTPRCSHQYGACSLHLVALTIFFAAFGLFSPRSALAESGRRYVVRVAGFEPAGATRLGGRGAAVLATDHTGITAVAKADQIDSVHRRYRR